ncbi:MAG TPA: fluoride efflux transporter CrcB [Fibrobacteria bacterium]|nr:fluoride efflux transporter CrcB [Fibrobacteria bacterium]
MQVVWIGIGGALGSVLRFFMQSRIQAAYPGNFPMGTLCVNLSGSLVIGFLGGWFLSQPVADNLKLFLMVGILGGYTTFSSFALENLILIREGHVKAVLIYLFTSNTLGVGLACGGFLAARALSRSVAGP